MAWRNEYSKIVEDMIFGLTGELPGNKFWMDPTKGSDGGDGSRQSPVKTLAAGYGMLRDGYNDILYFIPGATSATLALPATGTTGFTWAKSYAHLMGLGGSGVYGGRCRIGMASLAALGLLFSMTGAGNIFKNIHWQYGNGYGVTPWETLLLGAAASYNYFEDCQIDGPLNGAVEGANTYKNLAALSGSKSNTFVRCTIGKWNQQDAGAGNMLYLPGDNGEWHFMDCRFMWNTTVNTMKPINIVDLVSEYCYTLFEHCQFLGVGTSVTGLCASGTPAHGKSIFMNCTSIGVDEYDAGTNSRIFVANGSAVAGELGGKAVAIA